MPTRFRKFERVEVGRVYIRLKNFPPVRGGAGQFDFEKTYVEAYQRFREAALKSGSLVYPPGYAIDVRGEEGTFKGWARALTATGVLWQGVASYADVKNSVQELAKDVPYFAESVYERFVPNVAGKAAQDVTWKHSYATPGEVLKLINEIEDLERHLTDLSPKQVESRLTDVRMRLSRISRLISQEDMQKLLSAIQERNVPGLPSNIVEIPRVAIRSDDFGAELASPRVAKKIARASGTFEEIPTRRKFARHDLLIIPK